MNAAINRIACLLIGFFCFLSSDLHCEVYDCFIFYNELDLLDIRLNEMSDVVDKFVLVEMAETFQGNPKPMYFKENRQRYKKFLDKIIYVGITQRTKTDDPWQREAYQRNHILTGLKDCKKDDIILISDVDEIMSRDSIPRIIDALKHNWLVVCEHRMFRFFFNMEERPWLGAIAAPYRKFKNKNIDRIRKSYANNLPPPRENRVVINNAGWHFTSMGGFEKFIEKLRSFSHTPENTAGGLPPDQVNPSHITVYIEENCHLVPIDRTYPLYILENIDDYRKKGFIYE